jgi:hypothetical protein
MVFFAGEDRKFAGNDSALFLTFATSNELGSDALKALRLNSESKHNESRTGNQ